jgi:hypothetical protein
MAHWSEDSFRLELSVNPLSYVAQISDALAISESKVTLFVLPPNRVRENAKVAREIFAQITKAVTALPEADTVCFLLSAEDAAYLLPTVEYVLQCQLWVAVKTPPEDSFETGRTLPEGHLALLVLSRYKGSLRHTKTRIQYTYCPACGKTTKDYGGKKHVYHEYGTLMSDVWRDISCSLSGDITPVMDRLRDVFGLEPYRSLQVVDLRTCREWRSQRKTELIRDSRLPLEWSGETAPLDSQLINEDCLSALARIPANSVDFCFVDPPYNLKKRYDRWDDALESREYFHWCDRWLSELARVLKPGRTVAVMNIPLWAVRHFQHLATILDFQNWLAWEALSFPVRMIMPAHYAILCFSKGTPRALPGLDTEAIPLMEKEALTPLAESYCIRASCIAQRRRGMESDAGELSDLWHDIHRLKHNSRRVDHPCQLPPQLMRRLYALFTRPEEVVLDCFNGSGTSTLVAHQMGRRFIGIELSTQYHRLAEQRHQLIATGGDPFAKQEDSPKAKNSPVARLPKQQYIVSKKVLQLEVRRIAQLLGRLPNREEVRELSSYPLEYYEQYFHSWGEVCAAARTTGMSELPPDVPTQNIQMSLSL